jgi:very-short-patch-repair endonuclease
MADGNNTSIQCICGTCGVAFVRPKAWVKRGGGKFCSMPCYAAHQRVNPHGGNGAPAVPGRDERCKACKRTFRVGRSHNRNYCSKACRETVTRITKQCPQCKRDFTQLRCFNQTHCSNACLTASRPSKPCERCGKEMRTGKTRTKHCSEKCRRPPVFIICETCGKQKRVVPIYASQRFCSFRCYRRFVGETVPERNARLSLDALKIKFIQEHPIGRYAVDFYLPVTRTVLEIDEPYWHDKMKDRDAKKDAFLSLRGYDVRRLLATPLYGNWNAQMTAHIRDFLTMPLFSFATATTDEIGKTAPKQDRE